MNDGIITIPAIALRGITIMPSGVAHFDVSRKKSIKALEAVMTGDQRIFLVTQKDPDFDHPSKGRLVFSWYSSRSEAGHQNAGWLSTCTE